MYYYDGFAAWYQAGLTAQNQARGPYAGYINEDGNAFVRNIYTGKHIQITGESIRHGLNGGLNRLLTNARLGAVIGDLAQNAVPINALQNKAGNVTGTYAMAGYTTDSAGREFVAILTVEQRTGRVVNLEAYDMLHAVSGRQKRAARRARSSRGFTLSRLLASLQQISWSLSIAPIRASRKSILQNKDERV